MDDRSHSSVRAGLVADVGRAIAVAAGGALVFAPVEYALTLWSYVGPLRLASKLRLVALVATLAAVWWLVLALALIAVAVAARLVRSRIDPAAGRRIGWLVPGPLVGGVRSNVPRLWAVLAAAAVGGAVVQRAAVWASAGFKEPQLTGALIAAIAIAAAAGALVIHRGLRFAVAAGAGALAPLLGAANPLGRWRAAGVALAALALAALAVSWYTLPLIRPVLPVRLAISALATGLGLGLGARYHARARPHRRSRRGGLAVAGGGLAVVGATLLWLGAELETRYAAITASPALDRLIGVVRLANDLDRDGYGSLLGEHDCAPFDAAIHPGALDAADDAIDQDCDGADFELSMIRPPPGPTLPIPPGLRRRWNFLLITIDTLRYDHTTFGGYADGPLRRDTTPALAALVARSTSFAFCQAPSAGTMASIPAILTSKYFHSGIALGEAPRGVPPKLLPDNVTLPEIMKRGGYRTGAIGSHEWWNSWGVEQGVDDFDNSLGRTPDAFRVSAHQVTDRILAWVSRQRDRWFMWAHYIDPHGRYVAHPELVDYGSSEADLYDAEIRWTDQQIGRLLDELVRLDGASDTIVIITSDHGDSMAEHNVPLGTHGTALYREMLHVPLVFHVPGNPARKIAGAVSNLDIVPTVAELAGIDVRDLAFEGRSLIPALFYGVEDRDRIVFAETNAPAKQRAAISESWKLIYYLHSNVHELFDLRADPWEQRNLAPRAPPGLALMKRALQLWMSRVLHARDPLFNQTYRVIGDVVLAQPPVPPVRSERHTLGDGAIEVLGLGLASGGQLVPGARAQVHVYFRVVRQSSVIYRFALWAWQVEPGTPATAALPPTVVRAPARPTADGAYASDQWPAGQYIRETLTIQVPAGWTGTAAIGLVAVGPDGARAVATGDAPAGEPGVAVLGTIPVAAP